MSKNNVRKTPRADCSTPMEQWWWALSLTVVAIGVCHEVTEKTGRLDGTGKGESHQSSRLRSRVIGLYPCCEFTISKKFILITLSTHQKKCCCFRWEFNNKDCFFVPFKYNSYSILHLEWVYAESQNGKKCECVWFGRMEKKKKKRPRKREVLPLPNSGLWTGLKKVTLERTKNLDVTSFIFHLPFPVTIK